MSATKQSTVLFQAEVPGKPVPQPRPRITRGGGKYYPKGYAETRKLLVKSFKRAHRRRKPLAHVMRLEVAVAGARRNSDLSNHLKSIEDALVQAEVIKDDAITYLQEVWVRVVEGNPRTEVTLYRLHTSCGSIH